MILLGKETSRFAALLLCSLMISLSIAPVNADPGIVRPAKAESFEIKNHQFMLNGKPFNILSGEMHYSRIPHQYWRHRLKMAKAMGLNAITTYVFWNIHEPEKGHFNFHGDADLARFIRIAQEEGLFVLLRPGPYVCAEWESGDSPTGCSQKKTW